LRSWQRARGSAGLLQPCGSEAQYDRGLRALLWTAALLLTFASHVPQAHATPQPPRDVYAEARRPDQVRLTWRPGVEASPGKTLAERYEVFRDGRLIAETDELGLIDPWLFERQAYSYVVRAVDPQGRAAESAPVTVTTPQFQAGLELAPYLQQLSPTSVAVVWQTYAPAASSLHFGPAGGAPRVIRDTALRRDHVITVSGLSPDTLYAYRWESDGRIGAPAEFRTPPAARPRFSFGVIGDFGIPTPPSRANLKRLTQDSIDFAITTGDNAQLHAAEEEYRNYVIEPLRELIERRPFWPSIGNHDYENLHNYLRYFALPEPERYYGFRYGGVLFLALDSNRYDRRQKAWLRSELRRSGARCKVAYFHHPLWSSGRGYRNGVRKQRREKIAAILQRGGVDLVLNGHVQNYERSKPLRGGRVSRRRGIVYVVTGGGGAHLSPFVTRRRPRWSDRRGAFHHRLRITASEHRLVGRAIDTAGNTRDRFAVRCR
jgi:calcineurin-like phosphoesterase family protein